MQACAPEARSLGAVLSSRWIAGGGSTMKRVPRSGAVPNPTVPPMLLGDRLADRRPQAGVAQVAPSGHELDFAPALGHAAVEHVGGLARQLAQLVADAFLTCSVEERSTTSTYDGHGCGRRTGETDFL